MSSGVFNLEAREAAWRERRELVAVATLVQRAGGVVSMLELLDAAVIMRILDMPALACVPCGSGVYHSSVEAAVCGQ